jgi:hypothetical protein
VLDDRPSEALRMEVFSALVVAQDRGASVSSSRHMMARRYGLTVVEVEQIERQGLDHQWPPLE